MKNVSKILWHGSPSLIDPNELMPHESFLDAIWLSGTPEVAAIYAGPEGKVHGYVLDDETKLLAAFGTADGTGLNYPSEDEWGMVKEQLDIHGVILTELECLDAFKIENKFQPDLGSAGQPSWVALFYDLSELSSVGEELLEKCGFDGIMQTERLELALGDRRTVIAENKSIPYKMLVDQFKRELKSPSISVGLLNNSNLKHVTTMMSEDVISRQLSSKPMPSIGLDDMMKYSAAPVFSNLSHSI